MYIYLREANRARVLSENRPSLESRGEATIDERNGLPTYDEVTTNYWNMIYKD